MKNDKSRRKNCLPALKRLTLLVFVGVLAINLCGCAAVVLSVMSERTKVKRDFDIPYPRALDIVKGALKARDMQFKEVAVLGDIAELKTRYADGDKTIRIFIEKTGETGCRIAVRCGTSEAGKKEAEGILQSIADFADLCGPNTRFYPS